MKYKIVEHKGESENGCFVEVFKSDVNDNYELIDPDTSNNSEIISEKILTEEEYHEQYLD